MGEFHLSLQESVVTDALGAVQAKHAGRESGEPAGEAVAALSEADSEVVLGVTHGDDEGPERVALLDEGQAAASISIFGVEFHLETGTDVAPRALQGQRGFLVTAGHIEDFLVVLAG